MDGGSDKPVPFKNKSERSNKSRCEKEAISYNNPQVHSIIYGKLVEHIDPSKCKLDHHH